MHVAINGYFYDQPRTGSGQYLRHLWSALSEHSSSSEDRFTLLLPPGQVRDAPVPTSSAYRIIEARHPAIFGGRSHNLDKVWWEQWGVVSQTRHNRAHLLHSPYLSAPIRRTCPIVVTAHDMIPWVVPGYQGAAFVRIYLALAVAAARRADLIVADSEASRRDVIKVMGMPPRSVRTVYLGIETPEVYTAGQLEEVRSRFGLPEQFAFYIGGFDRRKNVPLLLRAWRRFLDSRPERRCKEGPALAIGGAVPEPGGVFPDVRGEAEALGLLGETDGSVRFLGRISESDKPLLMAASHMFIYPSAYEGFGFDPLEAMSVGCAVVSSNGGSLREVVGEGGLLVSANDEKELCGAIMRLWEDDGLRGQLGKQGRERAKLFTWERTAEQTRRLYSLALKRAGRLR